MIEPHFAEEARKRMEIRKGKQAGASVEILPPLEKGKARDQAAKVVLFILFVLFLGFVLETQAPPFDTL
jgi:hypothetical protein